MTVTYRRAFTSWKLLYEIKELVYVILKMKVNNFDKIQCSKLVVLENLFW